MKENPFPVDISVVVPVYNSAGTLKLLAQRLTATFKKMQVSFEMVLIDDRSQDTSWETLQELQKSGEFPELRIFRLSRNFGQHYTISAGLDKTRGRWVVVMDCDLQDQPEEIEKLYTKAKSGFDIVLGSRVFRHDRFGKRLGSRFFYWVLSLLTGVKHDPAVANFGIYNHKVIESLRLVREQIRYFPVMIRWVGFNSTKIEIIHSERTIGETSYNFRKLLNLGLQVILAYSDYPLRLTVKLGILMSFGALMLALIYVYMALAGHIVVAGWASVMISLFFLSGVIIFVLGVLGLYIGKIFEQVKNRPLYLISESVDPAETR